MKMTFSCRICAVVTFALISILQNYSLASEFVIDEKKEQYQIQIVTGVVLDVNGEPIVGASVVEKGTANGDITDLDGKFTLNVKTGTVLKVSYVGYQTYEVKAEKTMKIILKEDSELLSEVVVVGYGTQKKTSLTAAVSSVDGKIISQQPVADVSNTLGGRMAGVIFTQKSGEPGSDLSDIMIRGVSTTGNSAPLVIVDGVQRELSRLDPNSISSITVLKDAAAVAPYGMAGANGVILVTTKQGNSGAPQFSYNGYVGWQNPTVLTEFADSYEYACLFNQANDNQGQPHRFSDYDLEMYKSGKDPINYPNHNVLKELIKSNSPITSHNVQLSGGSEKFNYYISLNYLYQGGMWETTNMHKYSLMSKIQAQATKTTKIELAVTGRIEQYNYPGVASGGAGNIFSQAFRTPPIAPLVYPGGLAGEFEGRTVYGQIYQSGFNKYRNYVMYNQMVIEQDLPFVRGLKLKGVIAYDLKPIHKNIWKTPMPYYTVDMSSGSPKYVQAGSDGPEKPTYTQNYSENQSLTLQGQIQYNNTFGKHEVGGLVVFEMRDTQGDSFEASRLNYNVNIPELNNGSSDPADIKNSGNSSKTKQRSIIYRVNYAYDGKYLFETSARYDGSYYFAPDHRFGFFPSASIGWRISEENFLKGRFNWLSNLKLRASYGESGALAADPFQYLSSYNLYSNSAVLNGKPTQGLSELLEPNKYITWEKARKMDIGFDLGLLNNQISFSIDYFSEYRSNMLVKPQVTVPFEYGIGIAQENKGKMKNRGIEFSLNASNQFTKDFSAGLQVNFTYAKNKIVEIFETPATYNNPYRRQTGRPLGQKFGYKALGYFQLSDDLNGNGIIDSDEYNVKQPWGTVHPGDLKYQDTNKDGSITEDDMVPIGLSNIPQIVYGFSPSIRYKGFDLLLLFQGAAKRDFWIGDVGAWPFTNNSSVPKTALDVWTPNNPNARNPRVTTIPATNNTQYSSWWLHNGNYLRLKTGELGYTIPKSLADMVGIKSARIYVSGQNIFTWSKIKNFDPEISDQNGIYYPQQKVISIGVDIKF